MIPLPDIRGRIDHLAYDPDGRRLFIAEVANGSVDVVSLAQGKVVGHVSGLRKPQGIAWLPARSEFVVACGDGTVHFYRGSNWREVASLKLGEDADNVRVDSRNGNVVVGYGSGGLAIIDPSSHHVTARLTFEGHPEGFRLVAGKAYVNVPDDGAVLAADLDQHQVTARWPTGMHRLNFPMFIDPATGQPVIAYRLPAALARIDPTSGHTISIRNICGDSDDLFVTGATTLVVCGAGHVDVVRNGSIAARVDTRHGARTGLYVPELETLFVAVPARADPAAIMALRLTGPRGNP